MPVDYGLLGMTIRELRSEKGLSQEVLSGLAGIGRTHLTMIESGRIHAKLDTLSALATALDIPLSQLFARMEANRSGT